MMGLQKRPGREHALPHPLPGTTQPGYREVTLRKHKHKLSPNHSSVEPHLPPVQTELHEQEQTALRVVSPRLATPEAQEVLLSLVR